MTTCQERPRITLKLATSLDGRIALANGQSQWITGPRSRAHVHALRAAHDAILTGIGTVLSDDPQMTARPDGKLSEHQPRRVVLDSGLRLPEAAQILQGDPVWIYHCVDSPRQITNAEQIRIDKDADGRVDVQHAMSDLSVRGIQSLMVEAGALIAGTFVRAGFVDRIEWFRAPMILGGDGRACVAGLGLEQLDLSPMFHRVAVRECGADLWETYQRG